MILGMKLLNWKALSEDYGHYHTAAGNRYCHMVGIPLIVLAVVRWTQFGALPLTALVLPLYLLWSPLLGIAMACVIGAMAAVALVLPVWAAPAAFVLGWVFQFVGHIVYEKKSPAFQDNLIHLLVGPMWVLREILHCN